MTIRARLSLWYATVMFIALMVMGVLLYFHLVSWPREYARLHHQTYRQAEPADPDVFADVTGIVLWCGVPAMLLALAGGWWLMKKSLAPVTSLTLAAEKISADNLSERLPRAGNNDELDRLTEVFNSMLARLDDSFHRIREFTLHASHELKTPLTVLCGETETALRDESLSASERERLASQLDELQRLARIVDGLTLLTKADAGQVSLKLEPLRFDELVRDNFADLQILAELQHIQVELTECEEISVRGDRHRLRQLLLNLADNAVKYNQSRGRIAVSLRRAGIMAEFVIANAGPGISQESLPRIFDRFFRGDPTHGNNVDGCGLGLSIAKWIVSAHKGTIQIKSTPGELTTVTVHLPLEET
jgi:heavy metal sensor kinase